MRIFNTISAPCGGVLNSYTIAVPASKQIVLSIAVTSYKCNGEKQKCSFESGICQGPSL